MEDKKKTLQYYENNLSQINDLSIEKLKQLQNQAKQKGANNLAGLFKNLIQKQQKNLKDKNVMVNNSNVNLADVDLGWINDDPYKELSLKLPENVMNNIRKEYLENLDPRLLENRNKNLPLLKGQTQSDAISKISVNNQPQLDPNLIRKILNYLIIINNNLANVRNNVTDNDVPTIRPLTEDEIAKYKADKQINNVSFEESQIYDNSSVEVGPSNHNPMRENEKLSSQLMDQRHQHQKHQFTCLTVKTKVGNHYKDLPKAGIILKPF